jgi:ubiquinone/menaquinone biosynthesis C-methylase UbiE
MPLETASCVFCGETTDVVTEASGRDYEYDSTPLRFTFVRCRACRHCFLNPRPAPAAADLLYGDRYYTRTSDHQSAAFGLLGRVKDAVLRRRIREFVDHLPAGASLLEAGCGDGALLVSLRRARPDLRLTGVDLAWSPASEAALRAAQIDCIASPIESVRLPEQSFDVIVMNQVIEHVWDVRAALVTLRRALVPGGSLILATPNLDGYDRRFFRRSCWGGYYMPRHLNLFTPASLERLLEECGFRDVSIRFLTAPLVWMRSIQYAFRAGGVPGAALFTDANLPALAAFTALDRLALAAGLQTSNLQAVAHRG